MKYINVYIIKIIFYFQFCILVLHLAVDEEIPGYIQNLIIATYLKCTLKSSFMSAQLILGNQQLFSFSY